MTKQINITDRDLNRILDGDSSRLKLSPTSKENIEINTLKMTSPVVTEKPSVKVYDNTGVANGGASMEYNLIPERVPKTAIMISAKLLKTKKKDNISNNSGIGETVQVNNSVDDNSYIAGIADTKKSLKSVPTDENNITTPGVMSNDDDNNSNDRDLQIGVLRHEGVHMSGGRNIKNKIKLYENKLEDINVNDINVEANNTLTEKAFKNEDEIKNNVFDDSKQDIPKNVPEYGTSSSDIFGGTTLRNDDSIVSASKEETKAEPKNVNDLISSIPNPIENHENKVKVHEEKEDQLTDVHNKLFGIEHEVSHDIVSNESLVGVTSNTDEASKFRSRLQKLSKKKANVEETREANETVNQNLEKTMVNGTKLREELELYKKTIEKKITDIETKIAQEEAEALRRKAELEESLRKEEDNYNSMQHEINEFKEIERELGVSSSGMRR